MHGNFVVKHDTNLKRLGRQLGYGYPVKRDARIPGGGDAQEVDILQNDACGEVNGEGVNSARGEVALEYVIFSKPLALGVNLETQDCAVRGNYRL